MTELCNITFPTTPYSPITLEKQSNLSEHLTIQNSPILFGCRTGICGSCLVEIEGNIPAPNETEKELLEIIAPNNSKARLACQVNLSSDISITRIEKE